MQSPDEYYLTHQNRFHFILNEIGHLHLPKGAKILDVGCYPTYIFDQLGNLGYEVHGISSLHEPIKNHKNIYQLNIEKQKLPFPDQHFDLVLFSEVMEHLLYNPITYLKEFKRVLKPHASLIVTTPNAAHLKNRSKLFFGKSVSFSLKQLEESQPDDDSVYFRHNREYTASELKELVTKAGFEINQLSCFAAYSPFRKKLESDSLPVKFVKSTGFIVTLLIPSLRDSLFLQAIS